eukprot:scaffold9072_cov62-Phaeocystis_antarctica.AAC.5
MSRSQSGRPRGAFAASRRSRRRQARQHTRRLRGAPRATGSIAMSAHRQTAALRVRATARAARSNWRRRRRARRPAAPESRASRQIACGRISIRMGRTWARRAAHGKGGARAGGRPQRAMMWPSRPRCCRWIQIRPVSQTKRAVPWRRRG